MKVESQERGVENDWSEVEYGELKLSTKYNLSTSEKQTVLDSIDSTTGFYNLSAKLLDSDRRGNLKEPLLCTVGADRGLVSTQGICRRTRKARTQR